MKLKSAYEIGLSVRFSACLCSNARKYSLVAMLLIYVIDIYNAMFGIENGM